MQILEAALRKPATEREAYLRSACAGEEDHPHIVSVHDIGEFEGRQYLVTNMSTAAH